MRFVVAAVGRLKTGPERELAEHFRKRAMNVGRQVGIQDVEVIEIRESRAREPERRVLEESIALANAIPSDAVSVVLDEHGQNLDSASFARSVRAWRDAGKPVVAFVIGGADGLGAQIKHQANVSLAFGAVTWPHQLVRIMLLEQLYRVITILTGHPYHRG
jgi:23S rRNA (pseudouridine1915-N3)-methyltransferase